MDDVSVLRGATVWTLTGFVDEISLSGPDVWTKDDALTGTFRDQHISWA